MKPQRSPNALDYLLDAIGSGLLDFFPAAAESDNLVLGIALFFHGVAGLSSIVELCLVVGAEGVKVLAGKTGRDLAKPGRVEAGSGCT